MVSPWATEPDSIEFSTLGGWIATHASGMKKNRYGNIEDIVLGPEPSHLAGACCPGGCRRRARVQGIDPRLLAFGSEGNLGVVTRAVVSCTRCPRPRCTTPHVQVV